MALGTWAMAAAVIYQTKMMRKQVEVIVKEKERPTMVEFLGGVATPLGLKLDDELDALGKRKFNWNHKKMKSGRITTIDVPLLQLYARKFPRIQAEIEYHNLMVSNLVESLKMIDKSIYTSSFEQECHELVRKFNQESPETSRVPQNDIPRAPELIASFIIDNIEELPETHPYHYFWRNYGSHFLKIREKDEVATALKVTDFFSNALISYLQKFSERLLSLSERLMEEYRITVEEVRERFKKEE
jgi:hypothetical protein